MKNKLEQLQRLRRICEMLSTGPTKYISKEFLITRLEVSGRTIEADMKLLRDYYEAPIKYDRIKQGYGLTKPFVLTTDVPLLQKDISALKIAVSTLKQYQVIGLFKNLEGLLDKVERAVNFKTKAEKADYQFIHFESVPYFAGADLLDFFINAIEYQQVIGFSYQKFQGNLLSERILHPYFLKEHRNRWYVVGLDQKDGLIKSFGLDRISGHSISNLNYIENKADLPNLLEKSFGIFINFNEIPVEIILSFSPERARYLKTQPFHPQQLEPERVLKDDAVEFKVLFNLLINEELLMELARLGKDVTVISPPQLKEQLINYHQKAIEHLKR